MNLPIWVSLIRDCGQIEILVPATAVVRIIGDDGGSTVWVAGGPTLAELEVMHPPKEVAARIDAAIEERVNGIQRAIAAGPLVAVPRPS